MFKKVLIANRGEIALRVIRACRELGISTVAVFSEADRDAVYLDLADEKICIGPASPTDSYLNISQIISAAEITNADAIHPGYGFLAENPYFAEVCATCGITFIGPSSKVISAMGDKVRARRMMMKTGIPVIPGSENVLTGPDEAVKVARKIKYPVLLKAVAGGGGRGMRLANSETGLREGYVQAQQEASQAFGNGDLYLEKALNSPRHIEFQIMADSEGNTVYLPERECSIQRRHQKLVEESPSVAVDSKLRRRMGHTAVRAAKKSKYVTCGTVEFLLDTKGNFYFMEMNTRIQVEHPVTELVSGVDLVKMQILLAAGEKLKTQQDDVRISGHTIECRINCEDPNNDFMPSTGEITRLILPGGPGIRVDTHIYQGYNVLPFYDSMLAKLISKGRTREEAISRMRRALDEFVVEGVKTTVPFHKLVINDEFFQKGKIDTGFVQKRIYPASSTPS